MVLVLSLFTGCRKNPYAQMKDKPLPIEIEVVGHSSQIVAHTYVGEIEAQASIQLLFPVGGQLTSLQVHNGEKVKKGQVIATIDDTQARSMYESSEAILQQAQDGYRRLKEVHEQGGISEVKWVEMETNLRKAESMFTSAKKRLEGCSLVAPQDGIVNLNDVEVGQYLTLSQPIGQLLDLKGKRARFMVPESEVAAMKEGTPITISLPALQKEFEASIIENSYVSTRLAHTYRITAQLKDSPDTEVLLPGMVCRAIIKDENVHGYIISSGCIQTQQKGHSVWKIHNGKAYRTMVKISDFVSNGVLVSEGLQAGDTIVNKGYQKMYQGALVEF